MRSSFLITLSAIAGMMSWANDAQSAGSPPPAQFIYTTASPFIRQSAQLTINLLTGDSNFLEDPGRCLYACGTQASLPTQAWSGKLEADDVSQIFGLLETTAVDGNNTVLTGTSSDCSYETFTWSSAAGTKIISLECDPDLENDVKSLKILATHLLLKFRAQAQQQ